MKNESGGQEEYTIQRLSILLLIFWLLLQGIWRILDQTPPQGDQTFYIKGAVRIQESWNQPWPSFLQSLNDVTGTKIRPPGGSLLLVPWLTLFQNDLHGSGLSAVLWHAATLIILFYLGKRLFDTTTGLLAGIYFISLPLIYDTFIDPEFYFMTLLPLALLCCAFLWNAHRWNWIAWLGMGLVTAFALFTKWVFAVYLLGPFLVMIFESIPRIRQIKKKSGWIYLFGKILLMICPVCLVALAWYWPNRHSLYEAFDEIMELREFTPFEQGWNWRVLFYYPIKWLNQNKIIPLFYLVPGCMAAFFVLFPSRFISSERISSINALGYRLLLSSVLGTWIYFCIRYENVPVKYIFAMQPILAILAVSWIRLVPRVSIQKYLYAILLIFGLCNSIWMHFGPLSWIGNSKLPRTLEIAPNDYFLNYVIPMSQPPQIQHWPQERIAERIARIKREAPIQFGRDDSLQPVLVLPELYYFNWRNCDVALCLEGVPEAAFPLQNHNGLLRLAGAHYIITSRGQITRFGFEDRDTSAQTAAELNRLIDSAPQWFWNHFRMVHRDSLPYGLSELQVFRRVQPCDEEEATDLCEFWITNHPNNPEAWEQIAKIWAMLRIPPRMERAKDMSTWIRSVSGVKTSVKNQDVLSTVRAWQNREDFQSYEMLELGMCKLVDPALREELLHQCANRPSLCAWKAAWMLGKIYLEKRQFNTAREFLMKAWRLQRENPDIIRDLHRLAQTTQEPVGTQKFKTLEKLTRDLFNNNRRPILYQDAANLLLQSGDRSDAFWFAFQGFVVGLNRLQNTKSLHTVLQKNQHQLPDYETLPLPLDRFGDESSILMDHPIYLRSGESYGFPFLNLDGGTYRLTWKHRSTTNSTKLAFSLDEREIGSQTYNSDISSATVEFVFESPIWGDRLRIDCLEGEAELSSIQLQRIQMEIPFLDWDGSINVKGKNYHSLQIESGKGISFQTDSPWVRLNFSIQTDPRAWDVLLVRASGLDTRSMTGTLIVQDAESPEQEVVFTAPFQTNAGDETIEIPLPADAKRYPFMVGLRIQLENLPPANLRQIHSLHLRRK